MKTRKTYMSADVPEGGPQHELDHLHPVALCGAEAVKLMPMKFDGNVELDGGTRQMTRYHDVGEANRRTGSRRSRPGDQCPQVPRHNQARARNPKVSAPRSGAPALPRGARAIEGPWRSRL